MADPIVLYPRGQARIAHLPQAASWGLLPLSWIYGAVSASVRAARMLERRPSPGATTVISVGNLEVGGSGKTPFAMYLLREIAARGARAAFVSRGFGSVAARFPGVTVLAPREEIPAPVPGVRYLPRDIPGLPDEIGDEPALVARTHREVPVLLCRDKRDAVEASAVFAPDYVVVDDAFQSWSLERGVDVVLLDAAAPLGSGALLPAGTLREEPGALERADVVLYNGAETEEAAERAAREVLRRTGVRRPFAGVRRDVAVAAEGRVAALSAIARPAGFEASLRRCGVDVVLALRYPDHHAYTPDDAREILRLAARHRCDTIVTTAKDHVKLAPVTADGSGVVVARLEVSLTDPTVLDKILKPQTVSAASV